VIEGIGCTARVADGKRRDRGQSQRGDGEKTAISDEMLMPDSRGVLHGNAVADISGKPADLPIREESFDTVPSKSETAR